MAFRGGAVRGAERHDSPVRPSRNRDEEPNRGTGDDGIMTSHERDDPGHQALWGNFHPPTAACGWILHYAPPQGVHFPYYELPDPRVCHRARIGVLPTQ